MLTDGAVSNQHEIIQSIRKNCEWQDTDNIKVFSFGLGNSCQKDLINNSAIAGNGLSYFVSSRDETEIKNKVIDALQKAGEPALINCKFDLGVQLSQESLFVKSLQREIELGNLYRNDLV